MITFSQADDNKQYISFRCPADYMVVPLVFIGRHATAANIRYDNDELIVEITEKGFGFPLNEIRRLVPDATITSFCVDMDLESQRCYP